METTEVKINLNEERGKLKQKFASLMDDLLLFEEGKKEEMFGKRQVRLIETKRVLSEILLLL
jgi:uncharacterized protein YjbJ (UPF0337 family)